jgi:hypothetical protein
MAPQWLHQRPRARAQEPAAPTSLMPRFASAARAASIPCSLLHPGPAGCWSPATYGRATEGGAPATPASSGEVLSTPLWAPSDTPANQATTSRDPRLSTPPKIYWHGLTGAAGRARAEVVAPTRKALPATAAPLAACSDASPTARTCRSGCRPGCNGLARPAGRAPSSSCRGPYQPTRQRAGAAQQRALQRQNTCRSMKHAHAPAVLFYCSHEITAK